jgi:hypothetical protein
MNYTQLKLHNGKPEVMTYKIFQKDSLHKSVRSKPFPLILILRYSNPGISIGSAKASLDFTNAGILRSPSRFLACLTCSDLIESELPDPEENPASGTLFAGP